MNINKLHKWRLTHLTNRQMATILAFFIGIFASVAAYVLHFIIRQIQHLLTAGFDATTYNWLYLLFPVIGIYITSLFVRYVVKDNISHGITQVLYAISTKQSRLKAHNCWTSVISSAITIGFGGSVGAEAPIVLTGSAIGSNLGQLFKMDNKTLMLLVGCGASAAIAGIFKAPIAGLVFTLEVLMVDLSMAALLPILTSTVTATVFTYIFVGNRSLFDFTLDSAWNIDRIPASILLGLFCGMVSLYFIRMMSKCEGVFEQLKDYPFAKLFLGAILLSSLIFFFPSLYGEGYNSLNILLNGNTEADWNAVMNNSLFAGSSGLLVVYIALVLLTKIFATSATNGAGGVGGTFAPSLFVGGFGGFLFARVWNMNQVGTYIPEKNFTLLGMAGVMAGVMHAPLTGVFLIAELT
ncbi:MAG: chloride channel protein, partial [Prevotella buccalis]|nr:chloride channel protein [Hoylesella buccalis]